jgi:hypothetical protein
VGHQSKRRNAMRRRVDLVIFSCILLTLGLALLVPVPWFWAREIASHLMTKDSDCYYTCEKSLYFFTGALGVSSLVMILIGLLITWAGYARRMKLAWFVMFIIVFFWFFPYFARYVHLCSTSMDQYFLQSMNGNRALALIDGTILGVIDGDPAAENLSIYTVAFALMLLGLALPFRQFFLLRKPPGHENAES